MSSRPGAQEDTAAPDVRPPLSGGAVSNAHQRPRGAPTARLRSRRPPLATFPVSAASGCTFASRVILSVAIETHCDESISAAAPATCGVAIEVPLVKA